MAERVTVLRPATRRARPRRTASVEIDEQTRVGEVYLRSLMRAQLRLALAVGGAVLGLLAALPLLFALAPAVTEVRLVGLPLPWLLLGVLVYPLLVMAAWYYVRQAERVERAFADLVNRQ